MKINRIRLAYCANILELIAELAGQTTRRDAVVMFHRMVALIVAWEAVVLRQSTRRVLYRYAMLLMMVVVVRRAHEVQRLHGIHKAHYWMKHSVRIDVGLPF